MLRENILSLHLINHSKNFVDGSSDSFSSLSFNCFIQILSYFTSRYIGFLLYSDLDLMMSFHFIHLISMFKFVSI